jgi:hypothetical protein
MSRRRRQTATARAEDDYTKRLAVIRDDLVTASNLDRHKLSPADKERIYTTSLLILNREALERQLLRGCTVDSGELQRIANAIWELLPAPQAQLEVKFVGNEKEPDLKLLTDAQLTMFEALSAIARGERPQKVESKHSGRWRDARELLRLLDACEQRNELLDKHRNEIRDLIHTLLAPVIKIPSSLWPSSVPSPKPVAPSTLAAATPPSTQVQDNVTPLPVKPRSIHDGPGAPVKTENPDFYYDVGRSGFRRFDHPGF